MEKKNSHSAIYFIHHSIIAFRKHVWRKWAQPRTLPLIPFKRLLCGVVNTLVCSSHLLCVKFGSTGVCGAGSQEGWEERQRGPYVRGPETGSSWLWIALVVSQAITLRSLCPSCLLVHSGCLLNRKLKPQAEKIKVGRLFVITSFSCHWTDRGHHKIHQVRFMTF